MTDLSEHEFGGVSTDLKLALVEGYLKAFTTALNGRFSLMYIDAFAGTGERTVKHEAQDGGLLGDNISARVERLRGSARIAIEVHPRFDKLVFIDANRRHFDALTQLAKAYPERDIEVVRANANDVIQKATAIGNWSRVRAVMFLDPYGMHVEWKTLESIAKTKAIDVWYLVSLAGLFRQAARDERNLSDQKKKAISRMLGTDDWESVWYEQSQSLDLFGDLDRRRRVASVDQIEDFVRHRLRTIFPKVLKPLRLRNQQNVPTFSLFFAISNPEPRAMGLAQRIAGYLLQAGNSSQVRP